MPIFFFMQIADKNDASDPSLYQPFEPHVSDSLESDSSEPDDSDAYSSLESNAEGPSQTSHCPCDDPNHPCWTQTFHSSRPLNRKSLSLVIDILNLHLEANIANSNALGALNESEIVLQI